GLNHSYPTSIARARKSRHWFSDEEGHDTLREPSSRFYGCPQIYGKPDPTVNWTHWEQHSLLFKSLRD
ncbi:hypothetical protein BJ165DRAFT_1504740, partial [Panaeolus papilionaceus]